MKRIQHEELPRTLDAEFLRFNPPQFDLESLRNITSRHFGLTGDLSPLEGERDQNAKFVANDGQVYVLKISGINEDPDVVDFQVQALLHLEKYAPEICVPRLVRTRDGNASARQRTADGDEHLVRLLTYVAGTPMSKGPPTQLRTLRAIGNMQGQLCRTLSSFFHPSARHFMPWDSTNGLVFDKVLRSNMSADLQTLTTPILARLESETVPTLMGLRAQVIHNDVHSGNVMRRDESTEEVAGLIDFGDLIHAPLINDLAASGASFAENFENPIAAISALVEGFHAVLPLEEQEVELLHDLVLLRLILTIELLDFLLRNSDNPGVSREEFSSIVETLKRVAALDPMEARESYRRACGLAYGKKPYTIANGSELLDRRGTALGPTYSLFYEEPVHLVRGRGVWVYDADGREYLDCYNNVASVGHCHPHVVGALAGQAKALNTHTRYLHEAVVEYAERITATLPGDLNVCMLVCTGTEANDLAYRMAQTVTGHKGAIVTDQDYHGNSMAVTELSTCEYPVSERPDYLAVVNVPDVYRGAHQVSGAELGPKYANLVDGAIDQLEARGHGTAMFMCDAIFDGYGILAAPPNYLREVYAKVRAAGGLVIADEVQSGLCRLGDHMWGFEDSDVIPDIVTMGKPMGDGHPLAVVATTAEIAIEFAKKFSYFNTFGGNPVSAAVGNAVLDVIEKEQILQNVHDVGSYLANGLRQLAGRHDLIGDVRGKGLYLGVELVQDRITKEPAIKEADHVVNRLKQNGILVSRAGHLGNVLKIRPPLIFARPHAELLLDELERALAAC